MSESKSSPLLGRIAIQLKMISMDQLNAATQEQGKHGEERKLGQVLLDMGLINDAQLNKLHTVQQQVIDKHRAKQAASARTVDSPPVADTRPPVAPIRAPGAEAPGAAEAVAPPAAPIVEQAAAPVVEPIVSPPISEPGAARPEAPIVESAPPAAPIPAVAPPAPAPPASAPAAAPPAQPRPAPQVIESEESDSLDLSFAAHGDDDRRRLEETLGGAIQAGASDVHIHAGAPPRIRVNGEFVEASPTPITADDAERMVSSSLTEAQRNELMRHGELDFCFDIPGTGRFRANAYRQQRGFDVVYRSIPPEPPTLEQLNLPSELAKYTNYHQGMVLITGPAGCGKSATMAALVNLINEEREEHILTVEDPIEVLHPSKRCLVNQRHAGRDTASFARALRGALREDPDVIVIGELRDLETISLAMTAAETGHFVLATLHTNNAVRTISRMIGAFPSNQQGQVRTMLSESLRAVISQRLVPTADESGRLPALETLVINKAIGNLIREEKTIQIRSSIQTGRNHGMALLEQSLADMVKQGKITQEVALSIAEDKKLITGV